MHYSIHFKDIREKPLALTFLKQHGSDIAVASRGMRIDFQSKKGVTELRGLLKQNGLKAIISQVSPRAYGVG